MQDDPSSRVFRGDFSALRPVIGQEEAETYQVTSIATYNVSELARVLFLVSEELEEKGFRKIGLGFIKDVEKSLLNLSGVDYQDYLGQIASSPAIIEQTSDKLKTIFFDPLSFLSWEISNRFLREGFGSVYFFARYIENLPKFEHRLTGVVPLELASPEVRSCLRNSCKSLLSSYSDFVFDFVFDSFDLDDGVNMENYVVRAEIIKLEVEPLLKLLKNGE